MIWNARIFSPIMSFIPRHVSNRVTVAMMQFMRVLSGHGRAYVIANETVNISSWERHYAGSREDSYYIEHQSAMKDMNLGLSTMDYSGCEVIATYNVLVALAAEYTIGREVLPKLISEFELDGIMHSGRFGCSPGAIRDVLMRRGYKARLWYGLVDDIRPGDALVITYYNDRDNLARGVHTICVTRDGSRFTAHNVYQNAGTLSAENLKDVINLINGGRVRVISSVVVSSRS